MSKRQSVSLLQIMLGIAFGALLGVAVMVAHLFFEYNLGMFEEMKRLGPGRLFVYYATDGAIVGAVVGALAVSTRSLKLCIGVSIVIQVCLRALLVHSSAVKAPIFFSAVIPGILYGVILGLVASLITAKKVYTLTQGR